MPAALPLIACNATMACSALMAAALLPAPVELTLKKMEAAKTAQLTAQTAPVPCTALVAWTASSLATVSARPNAPWASSSTPFKGIATLAVHIATLATTPPHAPAVPSGMWFKRTELALLNALLACIQMVQHVTIAPTTAQPAKPSPNAHHATARRSFTTELVSASALLLLTWWLKTTVAFPVEITAQDAMRRTSASDAIQISFTTTAHAWTTAPTAPG